MGRQTARATMSPAKVSACSRSSDRLTKSIVFCSLIRAVEVSSSQTEHEQLRFYALTPTKSPLT